MAGPNPETDLRVLRNLIDEALMTVTAPEFPNGRGARAGEILASALALADDILAAPPGSSAATMGKLGGAKTAQRGSQYFREIAAKRKTRSGVRPKVQ